MNPVLRWVACAEFVFVGLAGLAVFIVTLGSHLPIVSTLFNPHAGSAVGLLVLVPALVLSALALLVGIPLALAKVIKSPVERTPRQLVVVSFGALLLLATACAAFFS